MSGYNNCPGVTLSHDMKSFVGFAEVGLIAEGSPYLLFPAGGARAVRVVAKGEDRQMRLAERGNPVAERMVEITAWQSAEAVG